MAENDFSAESPQNYEQKSICCFVVDVSSSMNDRSDSMSKTPIAALNEGLKEFHSEIANNSTTANRLEVAVVKFSHLVEIVIQPALVSEFSMPTLVANGTTAMVDGVREAIQLVESRKKWYKSTGQPYLRPWIILITDGQPDNGQDINGLAKEIEKGTKEKNFVFLPIGVENANMHVLTQLAGFTQDESKNWIHMLPMKLDGLKFHEFFKWVSRSMELYAASKDGDKLALPSPTWMSGFKV